MSNVSPKNLKTITMERYNRPSKEVML